jgi:hypothetical protein
LGSIDEPRRIARAAGDEALRGTPFRRDVRKLLWSARYDRVTVAMELQRSWASPQFYVNLGAHVDGIDQPVTFDPRDVTTYVSYTRLTAHARAFDETLLDFDREMPEAERRSAIAAALRAHALPLLAQWSTEAGLQRFAAEQPADSGYAQQLRWFLGIGPRPEWMVSNPATNDPRTVS